MDSIGSLAGLRPRVRAGTALVVAVALALAWGMKQYYRRASFDELGWVLAPTVELVQRLTGSTFEREAHYGYLSRLDRFEIVPACAGVNFLIAAFVSLCLGLVGTCDSARARVRLVVGSALAAYAATVLANATRIAIAIRLHGTLAGDGWLSPGRLHCAEGVAVYFLFLLLLFTLGSRLSGAGRDLAT